MAIHQIVPIPPLQEQRRIGAKVDELMRLCDGLEAAQGERLRRRNVLVAASQYHLTNASDTEAVRSQANFCLKHFSEFSRTSAHIGTLRQTILNLAVRGQLVPQDFNDAPISELLGRIMAETAALIGARAQEREYSASRLS